MTCQFLFQCCFNQHCTWQKLSNFNVCSHFNFTPSRMVILAQNSWCFSPFVAIYLFGGSALVGTRACPRQWRVDCQGIPPALRQNVLSSPATTHDVHDNHNNNNKKKKMQNRFDQLARWALFGSKRYSTYLSNLILSNLSYNPRRFGMVTSTGDKCVQNRHFSPTKTSNIIDVSSI